MSQSSSSRSTPGGPSSTSSPPFSLSALRLTSDFKSLLSSLFARGFEFEDIIASFERHALMGEAEDEMIAQMEGGARRSHVGPPKWVAAVEKELMIKRNYESKHNKSNQHNDLDTKGEMIDAPPSTPIAPPVVVRSMPAAAQASSYSSPSKPAPSTTQQSSFAAEFYNTAPSRSIYSSSYGYSAPVKPAPTKLAPVAVDAPHAGPSAAESAMAAQLAASTDAILESNRLAASMQGKIDLLENEANEERINKDRREQHSRDEEQCKLNDEHEAHKRWSSIIISDANQYTVGNTSGCTVMSLECSLLMLSSVPVSTDLIDSVLIAGSCYTSDLHTGLSDLLPVVDRYRTRIDVATEKQGSITEIGELITSLEHMSSTRGTGVCVLLTKPPESVLLYCNMNPVDASQPKFALFDSHKRDWHSGAAIITFSSGASIERYIEQSLFPLPNTDVNIDDMSLAESMYSYYDAAFVVLKTHDSSSASSSVALPPVVGLSSGEQLKLRRQLQLVGESTENERNKYEQPKAIVKTNSTIAPNKNANASSSSSSAAAHAIRIIPTNTAASAAELHASHEWEWDDNPSSTSTRPAAATIPVAAARSSESPSTSSAAHGGVSPHRRGSDAAAASADSVSAASKPGFISKMYSSIKSSLGFAPNRSRAAASKPTKQTEWGAAIKEFMLSRSAAENEIGIRGADFVPEWRQYFGHRLEYSDVNGAMNLKEFIENFPNMLIIVKGEKSEMRIKLKSGTPTSASSSSSSSAPQYKKHQGAGKYKKNHQHYPPSYANVAGGVNSTAAFAAAAAPSSTFDADAALAASLADSDAAEFDALARASREKAKQSDDDASAALIAQMMAADKQFDRDHALAVEMGDDESFDCPYCLDNVPLGDVFVAKCCDGHIRICRFCARANVLAELEDMKIPTCQCKDRLLDSDLLLLLTPTEFQDRYLKLSFEHAARDYELLSCSTPNCRVHVEAPKNTTEWACYSCDAKWCARCNTKWHEGMTCDQFKLTEQYAKEKKDVIDNIGALDIKPCPRAGCGVAIERMAGCNAMECAACKCGFCYLCGKDFGLDAHPHFSDPTDPCYNKCFTGLGAVYEQ